MGRRGQGNGNGTQKANSGREGTSSIDAISVAVVPAALFRPVVRFGPVLSFSMFPVRIVAIVPMMALSMRISVVMEMFISIFLLIAVDPVALAIFPLSSAGHCRTGEKNCRYGQHNTDFERFSDHGSFLLHHSQVAG